MLIRLANFMFSALVAAACGGGIVDAPEVRVAPLTGLAAPAAGELRRALEDEVRWLAAENPALSPCVLDASATTDDRGRLGASATTDASRVEVRVDLALACPDAPSRTSSATASALAPMGTGDAFASRHRAVETALRDAVRLAIVGLQRGED